MLFNSPLKNDLTFSTKFPQNITSLIYPSSTLPTINTPLLHPFGAHQNQRSPSLLEALFPLLSLLRKSPRRF